MFDESTIDPALHIQPNSTTWETVGSMAISLQDMFLQACKVGDIESVRLALSLNVDVNCQQGWSLRRAIRYQHPQIWDSLLLNRDISVNLGNRFGLTALHTAARFNVSSAVTDLLRHPAIRVNDRTVLGSSPLMVAVKYASKQATEILIRDKRVELDILDNQGRSLEDVIGAAVAHPLDEDKAHIFQVLQDERRVRQDGEGRRNSLEEEGLGIDGIHRTRVFGALKELVEELRELHRADLEKLENRQEEESRQIISIMDDQISQLLLSQEEERRMLMDRLMQEKEEHSERQQEETCRLLKKQEEETNLLQRSRGGEPDGCITAASPKPPGVNNNNRRPSIQTGAADRLSQGGGGSVSSVSPWELTTPDEGYLTSKETELPEMINSACKELECPICYEVMCPPSRIWQCKMGHVICETCKERVWRENGTQISCPTCKTAPFIGRNLALERVARSLFSSKPEEPTPQTK